MKRFMDVNFIPVVLLVCASIHAFEGRSVEACIYVVGSLVLRELADMNHKGDKKETP